MYSASLTQASSHGVILSVLIVAIALGVYFMLSKRAEILGASLIMLVLSFAAKDYYHIVYSGGALLLLAVLMYLTSFDEGTITGSFFYAGIGLFASMILYYLMPETIPAGMDHAFLISIGLAALIVLIEGFKGGFTYDSEAAIAIIAAFVIAFFLVSIVGITHLAWGIGFMVAGIVFEALTGGFIATTSFIAGFVIWLDDIVGYTAYNQNQHALSLLLPIGVVLVVIFLIMQWRD